MKKQRVLKLKLVSETLRSLEDQNFGQAKGLERTDLKKVVGERPNPTITCVGSDCPGC
jgi:hypothetical protein